jgi:hypothetical protein
MLKRNSNSDKKESIIDLLVVWISIKSDILGLYRK